MEKTPIAKKVEAIINDAKFTSACEKEIKEIMKDGKFDLNDMPQVLKMVVLIYDKSDNLHVNQGEVEEVFRLLIMELLKKMGWITLENTEEITKMVDRCMILLMLNVKTKSCRKSIFSCTR